LSFLSILSRERVGWAAREIAPGKKGEQNEVGKTGLHARRSGGRIGRVQPWFDLDRYRSGSGRHRQGRHRGAKNRHGSAERQDGHHRGGDRNGQANQPQ
jgi:hypothetical protein